MRLIGTIIVIILCGLPALFAGWPAAAPDWFDIRWQGAPLGVIAMCVLLAVLAAMAGVCSEAAKNRALPDKGAE